MEHAQAAVLRHVLLRGTAAADGPGGGAAHAVLVQALGGARARAAGTEQQLVLLNLEAVVQALHAVDLAAVATGSASAAEGSSEQVGGRGPAQQGRASSRVSGVIAYMSPAPVPLVSTAGQEGRGGWPALHSKGLTDAELRCRRPRELPCQGACVPERLSL